MGLVLSWFGVLLGLMMLIAHLATVVDRYAGLFESQNSKYWLYGFMMGMSLMSLLRDLINYYT